MTAAMSLLAQIASLPGTILLTLLSMMGLAAFPRQIVKVMPRRPAVLNIRSRAKGSKGQSGEETLSSWMKTNVPSLGDVFTPAWWLPKSVYLARLEGMGADIV